MLSSIKKPPNHVICIISKITSGQNEKPHIMKSPMNFEIFLQKARYLISHEERSLLQKAMLQQYISSTKRDQIIYSAQICQI